MSSNTSYKEYKEAFVSGMTGSSIGHINMVSLVALASIALHSALRTRLPPNRAIHFPAEYLILVIPLLLSVTLFANSPTYLLLIILVPTGILLLVPPREAGTPLPSSLSPSRASSPSRERDGSQTPVDGGSESTTAIAPLPYLTTYRAHMLLLTFICILAVDFPVFPRSLAKCETYGVSIMDLGVGSFVFSQGIVSALPLLKDPAYLRTRIVPKLSAISRKCMPLLILGLLRTVSVKGTEYPEHQTEYGTHWNFFITMGLIPIIQVLLHPLMLYVPISLVGVFAALSHQVSLSSGGLMDYVLSTPREGVISANKEGLISLTGYLAIHLLGLSVGTLVLPPSPSYFRRLQQQLWNPQSDSDSVIPREPNSDSESDDDTPSRHKSKVQNRRENDKTATELCSYAVVWWVLLGVCSVFGVGGGVSRRVANLPYIIWIAAFNTTFLLGYLLLDLIFFPSPLSKSIYSPTSKLKVQPDPIVFGRAKRSNRDAQGVAAAPALLEAINRNGLVLFLMANVTTGLVNLSIPTMYTSDSWAMGILAAYALVVSGLAWTCRDKKLWRV